VTQRSGTVYVNGLYRHGFLLAPALAQEAAKLVLGDDARKEDVNDADRQWRDA
jgi:glycine oxidase